MREGGYEGGREGGREGRKEGKREGKMNERMNEAMKAMRSESDLSSFKYSNNLIIKYQNVKKLKKEKLPKCFLNFLNKGSRRNCC